jgi:tRNA pseudouridine32 synthase/23S rRNA pseudouridine746 synthase
VPEYHVLVGETNTTAVAALKATSGLSKQLIKQAMKKGAVWVSVLDQGHKRLRRADKQLKPGQQLHLYYDPLVLGQVVTAPVLVADEGDYSVWYKPYGMLSQGSKWGDHCTINRWVEQHHRPQRPAFIVNRLDRAAQGLMLIAHSKTAASALSGLFAQRAIDKRYTALVAGALPQPLLLDSPIEGKTAVSHVSLLQYDAFTQYSLVSVKIDTGRKHQIRKHLSGAGLPIVGDRLYGHEKQESEVDLCLVSSYLAFLSPFDAKPKSYTLADEYLPKIS